MAEFPGDGGEGFDSALARFLLDLRSKSLTDPVLLNAFEACPRASFLPHIRAELLYAPIALPLPCGEEAEDPFLLARLLRLVEPAAGLTCCEIGTGSGYFTAILARLGMTVTSFERYRTLLGQAQAALHACGVEGVELRHSDGLAKQPESARYDRIVVNGAMELVPGHLFDRLSPGGLALGFRLRSGASRLTLWRKDKAGLVNEQDIGICRATPIRSGLPAIL